MTTRIVLRTPSLLLIGLTLGLCLVSIGNAKEEESKNVTVISTTSSADGGTEISRQLLSECIISLPRADALAADIQQKTEYLLNINGEVGKNGHTKVYSATVSVNYLLFQKELLVVGTRSVTSKEPIVKEIEKRLPKKQVFQSEAVDGDIYAGKSLKSYYFTSPESAIADSRRRAAVWIEQQRTLQCTDK